MKKMGLLILLMMGTLLFALAFTAAAGPRTSVTPAPAVALAALPAPHPHIHEGLDFMRSAKHELETAEHDFHGHRVKAIEHLNAAIHEAEICEMEP